MADIQAIESLEDLEADVFLRLPPETRQLIQDLRPDLIQSIAAQIPGLDALAQDESALFEKDLQAATDLAAAATKLNEFAQNAPDVIDALGKVAGAQQDAADRLNQVLGDAGILGGAGGPTVDLFGAAIELVPGIDENVIIEGIRGIAETIARDQEERIGEQLDGFQKELQAFLERERNRRDVKALGPRPGGG